MVNTSASAAHCHDIGSNGPVYHLAGTEKDRRPHGQGAVNPLLVDQAALCQPGIEGLSLGQDKVVLVELRIHLDLRASFAVDNLSLPAELNLVRKGQSV